MHRDEDYWAHVHSGEDTRELPTAPEVKEKARNAPVAAEIAAAVAPAAPRTGAGRSLQQAVSTILASSIKNSTTATYGSLWSLRWAAWTALRRIPLYLDGSDPRADEEELLQFVAHKTMVSLLGQGTIHVMLLALRRKHLLARYPGPLAD